MKYGYVVAGLSLAIAIAASSVLPTAARAASVAGDPVKGQKIYAEQKCNACHKIGATGGKLGPELTAVGTKRDAAWMGKYLVNPKGVDPKAKMPAVKVKGQDLDDVIAYLLTLKGK